MAADLEAVRVRPDPVGVVDDRRGQPQHPLLHRPQRRIGAAGRLRLCEGHDHAPVELRHREPILPDEGSAFLAAIPIVDT